MARLLLIDDDAEVRAPIAAWLVRHGHEVEQAGDGGEGLAKLAQGVFDLVITDIIMPEVEGIETIMQIRKDYPLLPVIAISGGGSREPDLALHPASRLGAHATMRKPFRAAELAETIELLLSERAGGRGQPGDVA